MKTLRILDTELEFVRLVSAHPTPWRTGGGHFHEGLGSISMWRDFPQRVADATGCEAVVFSRYGYGRSTQLGTQARTPRYMHDEALKTLPAVLDALELERPFPLRTQRWRLDRTDQRWRHDHPLSGIVLMAPHVLVEELTLAGIRRAVEVYDSTDLPARLGRYHQNVESVFRAWQGIWLNPAFRDWNIEEYLPSPSPARSWPSRVRTTSTGRWTRSTASPVRFGTSTCGQAGRLPSSPHRINPKRS